MRISEHTNNAIDGRLYKKIVDLMPIPCVDIIVKYGDGFLLGKRNNHPAKNKWWFPGGRILKGESSSDAAIRKVREETGLLIKDVRFFTTVDYFFRAGILGGAVHSVTLIFIANADSVNILPSDNQHAEFKWFSKINKGWEKYIRNILESAGYTY